MTYPVRDTAREFAQDLRNIARDFSRGIENAVNGAIERTWQGIDNRSSTIRGWSVDSGDYRASHGIKFGSTPSNVEGLRSGSGPSTPMPRVKKWKIASGDIWFFNNQEYATVIDYGEYPNPPKLGSYVPGIGWVKKSRGGHLRSAPRGVYILAELEFPAYFNQEAKVYLKEA